MTEPRNLLRFYVSCPPGLEPALALEYHALNLVRCKRNPDQDADLKTAPGEEKGGMEFEGSFEDIFRCNLYLRSASRVSVRLGDFKAIGFAELRKKASKLDWSIFLRPGQPIHVQAVCHKSRLYHSDAVAERVAGAVNDHFSPSGLSCTQSDRGQLIQVRLVNDLCTISIDSSGDLLHRRGYRQALAKAPLRENIAAGMILLSEWDQSSPLIDPFCGSGTIPIEASLLASRIPPGLAREFQFQTWPVFDPAEWQQIVAQAKGAIQAHSTEIRAYDRDQGAVEMAKANAARAGQKDAVQFAVQALSYLQPSHEAGWIITNPPYGIRTSTSRDLRDLYARFGAILKERFKNWGLCMISSDDRLAANLGIGSPSKERSVSNGGIPVKIQQYKI